MAHIFGMVPDELSIFRMLWFSFYIVFFSFGLLLISTCVSVENEKQFMFYRLFDKNDLYGFDQAQVSLEYSPQLIHLQSYRKRFCESISPSASERWRIMNVDECMFCLQTRSMYNFVSQSHVEPILPSEIISNLLSDAIHDQSNQLLDILQSNKFDKEIYPMIVPPLNHYDDYMVQYLYSVWTAYLDETLFDNHAPSTVCVINPSNFSMQLLRTIVYLVELDRYLESTSSPSSWNIGINRLKMGRGYKRIQYFIHGMGEIDRRGLKVGIALIIHELGINNRVQFSEHDVDVFEWEEDEQRYDDILPCDVLVAYYNEITPHHNVPIDAVVENPFLFHRTIPVIHISDGLLSAQPGYASDPIYQNDNLGDIHKGLRNMPYQDKRWIRWDLIGTSVNSFQQWNDRYNRQKFTCGWSLFTVEITEFLDVEKAKTIRFGVSTNLHHQQEHHNDSSLDKRVIIAITFRSHLFIETAYGLRDQIHRFTALSSSWDIDVDIMCEGINYGRYLDYVEKGIRVLQIIIGPHIPQLSLTSNIVLFHTENMWDPYMLPVFAKNDKEYNINNQRRLAKQRYLDLLRNALAVLVYADANIESLRSLLEYSFHGGTQVCNKTSMTSFYRIPFYSISLYHQKRMWSCPPSPTDEPLSPTVWDIGFVGSLSPRRQKYLNYLMTELNARGFSNTTVFIPDRNGWVDQGDLYMKEYVYSHSKVVVNVHQYESDVSCLETHRINSVLSVGRPVVSERSLLCPELETFYRTDTNIEPDEMNIDPVLFFDDWTHSVDLILQILRVEGTHAYQLLSSKVTRKYCQLISDGRIFREFLEQTMSRLTFKQ